MTIESPIFEWIIANRDVLWPCASVAIGVTTAAIHYKKDATHKSTIRKVEDLHRSNTETSKQQAAEAQKVYNHTVYDMGRNHEKRMIDMAAEFKEKHHDLRTEYTRQFEDNRNNYAKLEASLRRSTDDELARQRVSHTESLQYKNSEIEELKQKIVNLSKEEAQVEASTQGRVGEYTERSPDFQSGERVAEALEKAQDRLPIVIPPAQQNALEDPHEKINADNVNGTNEHSSLPSIPGHFLFAPRGYRTLNLIDQMAELTESNLRFVAAKIMPRFQEYLEVKRSPQDGDRITISGQGFIEDGGTMRAIEGTSFDKLRMVLGSKFLIDDLEGQIAGLQIDREYLLRAKFPDDYHADELAGMVALFRFKIEKVEEPATNALLEDLDSDAAERKGRALEFLREISERLFNEARAHGLKRQLLNQLDENNKHIEAPPEMVAAEHEALWHAQLNELQMLGLPNQALGKPVDEAKAELLPLAERRVRLGLVLSKLQLEAERDGFEVTDEDIDAEINKRIEAAGPAKDKIRELFEKPENRRTLRGPLLEDKVTQWLYKINPPRQSLVDAKELLHEERW